MTTQSIRLKEPDLLMSTVFVPRASSVPCAVPRASSLPYAALHGQVAAHGQPRARLHPHSHSPDPPSLVARLPPPLLHTSAHCPLHLLHTCSTPPSSLRHTSATPPSHLRHTSAQVKGVTGACIQSTVPYIRDPVPIVILFRALGFVADRDVLEHIVCDFSDPTLMEMVREPAARACGATRRHASAGGAGRNLVIWRRGDGARSAALPSRGGSRARGLAVWRYGEMARPSCEAALPSSLPLSHPTVHTCPATVHRCARRSRRRS